MIVMFMDSKRTFDVPCTVEVEHTNESLHAHVTFKEKVEIEPGDEVEVHGPPIEVPFGESGSFERTATVRQATWLGRRWAKFTGRFELMELCEFSFTSGEKL
jgi:hypothetical protein